ncbi:transmembrane protein 241 isoform X3 [Rhineura floridana]|uniref:transmembrane protein 241 isoform X3 n=1 Tax=Rhineura floridana TaxID=261503 RepID=UPI002AC81484|nr:transmembrane protein 241 isoform X3 [Rhineura floridana]
MYLKRPAAGLAFCLFYLSSYFTNKYVLSVLKFTYPTLFQGWQTLVGGFFLHISWKIGWIEINSSSRSEVLSWLPASALFVGIIYSGSRALSRLPIPIFLTLHNAADVITCGVKTFLQKEQTSILKISRVLFLLVAAGCLPLYDSQFDADGYFWALVHLLCVGAYKVYQKLWRPNSLSDSEQQYINYAFSVVMLALASHPTGDLFSALEFQFLYFYSFHSSCFARLSQLVYRHSSLRLQLMYQLPVVFCLVDLLKPCFFTLKGLAYEYRGQMRKKRMPKHSHQE